MLNLIKQEVEKQENLMETENGAISYKTSGSALVDINFKIASLRNSTDDKIIQLFDKAFYENKEYAVKWLFFVRDIREGIGERRLFRVCYRRLADLDMDLFCNNLHNISEYGRWDDLISLLGISDVTDQYIIKIINEQLQNDLMHYNNNQSISLLAKWMPSENASSKVTKKMAKKVRQLLKLTPRKYRLMLSKLRAYSNVVEVKMCNNQWCDIDYSQVPSLANLRYKNAFLEHDRERRVMFLENVAQGKTKINMSVATPVDVVSRYGYVFEYDETLELAWQNLQDVMVSDTLVVADGSGSMTIPVSGNITALNVANALAIYTSEHNSGIYKNKYITFSDKPQFVEFKDNDTLLNKLSIARLHNEVANTNIEAVFDLILHVAIQNNIPQNEMIKNVLIISDMEFDAAQRGWHRNSNVLTQSLFDEIKDRYNQAGYQLPRLIFWNVNSRTQGVPLTENELGVALISGFSQNVLKMVMSDKYDPYEVLIDIITSERYDQIVC